MKNFYTKTKDSSFEWVVSFLYVSNLFTYSFDLHLSFDFKLNIELNIYLYIKWLLKIINAFKFIVKNS